MLVPELVGWILFWPERPFADALLIVYGQIAATMNNLRGFVDDGKPMEPDEAPRTSDESGIAPIIASPDAPSLFISYSHRDGNFLDQFRVHLKPLERIAVMDAWSDKQIVPGSQWYSDIKKALARAKVAVLLVTPHFLASDFIHNQELTPLLRKAGAGGLKILWIPVRACSYQATALAKYQSVIPPDKPIAEMKANRDKAWVKVCDVIRKTLEK